MMKKDLINKNVVRAISLGLSAVMLTTPMTALAAEGTDVDTTGADGDKIEATDAIDAKNDNVKTVEGLVETAQQSTTDAGVSYDGDGFGSADDAAKAAGDALDNAIDAGLELSETVVVGEGENAETVGYDNVVDKEEFSNDILDNVEDSLLQLDQTETALDNVADNVDESVDKANESLDAFDSINAQDAKDAATEAEDAANLAKDPAANEETVNQAVIDASNAVAEVEAIAKEAQDAYDVAADELDKARIAADEAQAKYEAAQADLNTTKEEMELAYQAAEDAKRYADALQQEVDEKKAEFEKANAVALNLADLQQKMYDEAKKTNINTYKVGEGKLFGNESASSAYWNTSLDYFKAYMQYMFKDETDVTFEWKKTTYTYEGVSYGNAGGNAYIIRYKDADGKDVERYFNYHAVDKDGNIEIYEKFDNYQAAIEGVEAVEGKKAVYGYAIMDENGEVAKNEDGSNKVYVSSEGDIFADVTTTLEDGTEEKSKWVADKDTAETETAIDLGTQSYDETAETTYKTTEVIVVDEVVGTETVRVENTDDGLKREFWNKLECGWAIHNYTKQTGNTADVKYKLGDETFTVRFDGMLTWDDLEEFFASIIYSGQYEVVYYTETEQNITQPKTVVVENTYAVVTTTTTEDVNDVNNNGEYNTVEEDWVDGYYATVKSAQEVAEEAAEAKKAELEKLGYDVTEVKVYKVNSSDNENWKYEITYTYTDKWGNAKSHTTKRSNIKAEKGDWVDGHYATVKSAEEVAEEAAKAELANYPESEGYDVSYEVYEITDRWGSGTGKYTYRITGTKTSTNTSESVELVSTTTYDATEYKYVMTEAAIEAVEGVDPVAEKRWWSENKASFDDTIMKQAMNDALTKLNAYAAQQKAAADAVAAAEKARQDVDNARAALNNLKIGAEYEAAVKNLEAAEDRLAKAEEKLAEITKEVERAQDAYEEAAAELGRFIPDPSTGGESGGTTGGEGGTTGGTTPTTPVVPVVPGAEIAEGGATVTPVAGGAGAGAGAGAAQNLVDIDDEETPLAAGIDNGNGNGDANGGDGDDVLVAGAEEDETAIVAIEDEETPLASGSRPDGKMSWWWLLIVALLGATGYKMYKDHQKKKEEAAQEA